MILEKIRPYTSMPYVKSKKGFTLAEMNIALFVGLLGMLAIMGFVVEHFRINFKSEQRNLANHDMRRFAADVLLYGKDSQYFYMYNSFAAADRNSASNRLAQGIAGDFVVFVTEQTPTLPSSGPRPIQQIVGFFKDTATAGTINNTFPIREFVLTFNPASTSSVESLLPTESSYANYKIVAPGAVGLTNNMLFYNYWNQSVLVNVQMAHGTNTRPITNTLNFTVTPRG